MLFYIDIDLHSRLSTTISACLLSVILFILACPPYLPPIPSDLSPYVSSPHHFLWAEYPSISRFLCAFRRSLSRWLTSRWTSRIHAPVFDKAKGSPPSHSYHTSLYAHDNRIGKEAVTLLTVGDRGSIAWIWVTTMYSYFRSLFVWTLWDGSFELRP